MSFVEPITPVVGFFLPKLQRGGNTMYTRYTDEQTKRAGRKDGRHRYQELQQAANPARTLLPHHRCQAGVG